MKFERMFVAPVALSLFVACASSSTPPTPQQSGGVGGDGVGTADTAPDKNPQGVAYPTDGIGTNPRSGDRAGDRIQNYKFLGYPNGDASQGLQPISLADFYDPTGANFKLIHIQASGSWCIHCRNEITAVTPIKADLDQRKVVWLVSLAEGPTPGTPSTTSDLKEWVSTFNAPYPHVLDPGNKNLGPFYDAAALPWNANISAKTMEILTADVGAIENAPGILAELDSILPEVDSGGLAK